MLPDTSITNAMEFSDFRLRNLAKTSSPTVERMSFRNMLVASIAKSAAILCKLKSNQKKGEITRLFGCALLHALYLANVGFSFRISI